MIDIYNMIDFKVEQFYIAVDMYVAKNEKNMMVGNRGKYLNWKEEEKERTIFGALLRMATYHVGRRRCVIMSLKRSFYCFFVQ